jgi:hypothetical protein
MMKTVGGGSIGTVAVAGAATAVAGAIFAPAIPFMIAGGFAGGGLWGASASKEEKQAREGVMVGSQFLEVTLGIATLVIIKYVKGSTS